jgi:hypothetical protein
VPQAYQQEQPQQQRRLPASLQGGAAGQAGPSVAGGATGAAGAAPPNPAMQGALQALVLEMEQSTGESASPLASRRYCTPQVAPRQGASAWLGLSTQPAASSCRGATCRSAPYAARAWCAQHCPLLCARPWGVGPSSGALLAPAAAAAGEEERSPPEHTLLINPLRHQRMALAWMCRREASGNPSGGSTAPAPPAQHRPRPALPSLPACAASNALRYLVASAPASSTVPQRCRCRPAGRVLPTPGPCPPAPRPSFSSSTSAAAAASWAGSGPPAAPCSRAPWPTSHTPSLPSRCRAGGILADDQGLGKTVSTISLILTRSPDRIAAEAEAEAEAAAAAAAAARQDSSMQIGDSDSDILEMLDVADSAAGPSAAAGASAAAAAGEGQDPDLPVEVSGAHLPAAGTLVLCPTSVLHQWSRELATKVDPRAHCSVHVYHGREKVRGPEGAGQQSRRSAWRRAGASGAAHAGPLGRPCPGRHPACCLLPAAAPPPEQPGSPPSPERPSLAPGFPRRCLWPRCWRASPWC